MSTRAQIIFWLAAFAFFIGFIYIFQPVLLPFILGMGVAYLLNPPVTAMGNWGISRGVAALIILTGFFLVAGGLLAVAIPILFDEINQLSRDLPRFAQSVWDFIEPFLQKLKARLGYDTDFVPQDLLKDNSGSALNLTRELLGGLAAGGQAVLGLLSLIIVMPVAAFFMIKEWPHISQWVQDLMPRDHKDTIMNLLKDIDRKLSGFIRGQLTVVLVLAVMYALALSLAGLEYGFVIGIGAGLLSIIPLLGSTVGLLISVIMAWVQSGDLLYVALIAGIFLGGQLIEGNFLTPKLVGDSVGMHPLWVFFALMAGGALFGILGMLLAVPVLAVLGVLATFAIAQYKASPYYKSKKTKSEAQKKKKAS